MFQRQNYRDAADAFLALSKKYETSAKAPDALLRLGQSLAALNEKELACATFGEVARKYPRASLAVKQVGRAGTEACPLLSRRITPSRSAMPRPTRCLPISAEASRALAPRGLWRGPNSTALLYLARAGESGISRPRNCVPSRSTTACGRSRGTKRRR